MRVNASTSARLVFSALALLLLGFGPGCASAELKPTTAPNTQAATAGALDEWTLAALPDWTDKYAEKTSNGPRYFKIDALMAQFNLSRAQAIEVQNLYLDQRRESRDSAARNPNLG